MRLLLVEDDNGIGQVLVRGLTAAGHTVEWLFHGRDTAPCLARTPYDALILDLMLPDMDGMEVCGQVRQMECQVPIMILSARDQLDQRVKGLDAGADDYLTKPFAFEELLARLRALQRRARTDSRPARLVAGDLSLDPASHTVWRGGRTIELTPREFYLLEYLLENAGKVLSRASILAKVWGIHAEVNDNTVDVYVSYLRKKLDLSDRLVTVRGIGFKLLDE